MGETYRHCDTLGHTLSEALKNALVFTLHYVMAKRLETMGGLDEEVENWRDTMRCGGLRTSRLQG